MNEILLLLLCCGSWALLAVRRPGWKGLQPARSIQRRIRRQGPQRLEPDALPRLVRQVAALLAAGRTGPVLWSVLGQVLAARNGRGPVSHGERAGPAAAENNATLMLILAVERASAMGLPTDVALRSACQVLDSGGLFHRRVDPAQKRMWLDMAACFHVCESSGAPVAGVLERLAATLEAEQDAAALRDTALAGPRATVRLLNWLPFLGLALGIFMGVDPVAVLLGGPPGWALLAAGLGLVMAGRAWSARMIAAAARTPAPGNSRRIPRGRKSLRAGPRRG